MSDTDNHLAEYAAIYSSLITVEEAAKIATVPRKTIYYWSSLGKLDGCKHRQGKHIRFSRDGFVLFLLNRNSSGIQ